MHATEKGTHIDFWDILKELSGNVFAASIHCLRGHFVVREPVAVGTVGIGSAGCGMIDARRRDDSH